MPSIAELYALQEVDLALDASRDGLTDVESHLGESPEVTEATEAETEHREALRSAQREFKDREGEADQLREKIEEVQTQLYRPGVIRSPKELEDLQLELESLKRRRSELEDQALEAMDAMEEAQKSLKEAEEHLVELAQSHDSGQAQLGGRKGRLEGDLVTLEERRTEQLELVDANLLALYDRLRANRQGRAVAKVAGGACQGCRISLPVNLVQRARAGKEVVQCSSCERILYVS